MTGKELFEAIKNQKMRGFYLALNGNICCNIGIYLISIFINDISDCVEISIDSCYRGAFDNCINWVTVYSLEDAESTIQDFIIYCYENTAS